MARSRQKWQEGVGGALTDNLSYGNIISVHTGTDESAPMLTAHGIEELRDMLRDARRSPAQWSDFLEDFAGDPDIIARVKEKGPR